MRSRLTLLLAAVATVALGVAPAVAGAQTITLSANGKPLGLGAEIKGTSTDSLFSHPNGTTTKCPQVEFRGELLSNETDPIKILQLGAVEFPQVCLASGGPLGSKDIRVVKGSFHVRTGLGEHGQIPLYSEELDEYAAYKADFGQVEFDYEYKWYGSGVFQGPCHATGSGVEGWRPYGAGTILAWRDQWFSDPGCNPENMEFEGILGLLTDKSGNLITSTITE